MCGARLAQMEGVGQAWHNDFKDNTHPMREESDILHVVRLGRHDDLNVLSGARVHAHKLLLEGLDNLAVVCPEVRSHADIDAGRLHTISE